MTSPVKYGPRGLSGVRHTAGVASALVAEPTTIRHPAVTVVSDVAPADARALSKALFVRLTALEEGSAEHAYVRNTLVELNLTLVHYAAKRLRTRSESMEDVLQAGTIGLIKAINRFDPTRGVEFPTFAVPTVIGEIKRFFRDTTWAVRVPRRLKELCQSLQSAMDALEQNLGRPPTVPELAEHLGLDTDEVIEALAAANGYSAVSLDAPTDDDEADALTDHVGVDDLDLERIEDLVALKPAIAALGERERKILALRFVHDMTQAQIGAELGISQMHVSRLLSRALARLRTRLTSQR